MKAAGTGLVASALLATGVAGQVPGDQGFSLGDPEAPHRVVEFLDFGCSACRQFAKASFGELKRAHVDTGEIRWTVVPFELGSFRHSGKAVVAALCAAEQGAFWLVHDRLFESQTEWQEAKRPELLFQEIMVGLGLDTEAYARCFEDGDTEDRAKDLRKLARKSGVRATPGFLVNGHLVFGAFSPEQFREVLAEYPPRS